MLSKNQRISDLDFDAPVFGLTTGQNQSGSPPNIECCPSCDSPFPNLATIDDLAEELSWGFLLIEEGKIRFQTGQIDARAEDGKQADRQFSEVGDRLNKGSSVSYLAIADWHLDRLQDAEEVKERALNLLRQLNSVAETKIRVLEQTLNTRGSIVLALGRPEVTSSIWQQAQTEYDRIGNELGKIDTQISAGALQNFGQNLGLYPVCFNEDRQNLSPQLDDGLIRPDRTRLSQQQIRTFVFVVDRVFQNVRTATLFDGQDYSIEQYSIAVTANGRSLQPHPLTAQRIEVLLGELTHAREEFPV